MSAGLSPPSSPDTAQPDDQKMEDFPTNGLCLQLAPFDLEKIYDYELGGHHPVHLGDDLGDNKRYRVLHKLGHGGSATVWLCRDTEVQETTKYVAIKILMAEISTEHCPELRIKAIQSLLTTEELEGYDFLGFPLDQFRIDGPNGKHLAFVYPVLGPSVSFGRFGTSHELETTLRNISTKLVEAIAFLHSYGICHGDLTPSNILHCVTGLDGLAESEVLRVLGEPKQNPVLKKSDERHEETTAPQYLVYPIRWSDVDSQYISEEGRLIDFGESFNVSHPPEDLGIPGPYRSPELILDKISGRNSDIWALGCTLFEIRTGRKLFAPFDDEDDDYIDAMVQVLGKLPEPWWSTTWEPRKKWYKDDTDEQGRVVWAAEISTKAETDSGYEQKVSTGSVHPSIAEGSRSLMEMLAPGLWYLPDRAPEVHREIPHKEQEVFADLLSRLLEFKPKDRITAKAALEHEWFKLS